MREGSSYAVTSSTQLRSLSMPAVIKLVAAIKMVDAGKKNAAGIVVAAIIGSR